MDKTDKEIRRYFKNIFGFRVRNVEPFRIALIHKSVSSNDAIGGRLNNERLEGELVGKTLAFVLIYCAITFAVALLLSIIEPLANDVGTALGAALTSLSNVGPGFGAVNPAGNFAEFNAASKILLAVTMIVGRLELFTILVLLLPSTWKR